MKLFNVLIRNRNSITFVTISFIGTEFKASFAASIQSWFGLFVYKDCISKLRRNVSSVVFRSIDFIVRCIFDIK